MGGDLAGDQGRPVATSAPRVVDSHLHLFAASTGFEYSWLHNDEDIFGSLAPLRAEAWDGTRLALEVRHAPVAKAVVVQCSEPQRDVAVAETRWVQQQTTSMSMIAAFVAGADLRAEDIEDTLDAHLEASALMRGVRDLSTVGMLEDPAMERGLAALASRGLTWDLFAFPFEAEQAAACIRRAPSLRVVVEHCGFPLERSREYFEGWAKGLRVLAESGDVWCKLSGLAMTDHAWTVDSLRPWVLECVEVFGPDRCMFGSNFPVERLYGSYDATVAAYAEILGGLSTAESDRIFRANAETFYRL